MSLSSHHEDYLLRQVRAVAVALARILGLRGGGQVVEARTELEAAYGLLLGPQDDLVRNIDSRSAAQLLSAPERILAYARLVHEEAAQTADPEAASALRRRALELGIHAVLRGPMDEDAKAFVKDVASEAPKLHLGLEYRDELRKILGRDVPET